MHLHLRLIVYVLVLDQPPFYFVSHVPCLNTLINFHVVLKYGFVGTCPGIEPVTGTGHWFNSRTSTHEAIFQNHMKIDECIQTRHVRYKIKWRLVQYKNVNDQT